MNKKIALSAIAMFAVMMGIGAFAPSVLAEKMESVDICHNGEDDAGNPIVELITVNGNSVQKHLDNHGDVIAVDGTCPT